MKYRIDIERYSPEKKSYIESFYYETDSETETVANALAFLNLQSNLKNVDGQDAEPIGWDCGCMQKKCGACAMVVNGRPALACDSRLSRCGKVIRLSPLKKFPVVRDLIVDRSVMFENLKTIKLYFEDNADFSEKAAGIAYEASRCLQCGCCLEVCPNFIAGGTFTGMASAVPVTRLFAELPAEKIKELSKLYNKHIFEGCGKSLACRNICPAKIDIEKMLVNSNAAAVWKRVFRHQEGVKNGKIRI